MRRRRRPDRPPRCDITQLAHMSQRNPWHQAVLLFLGHGGNIRPFRGARSDRVYRNIPWGQAIAQIHSNSIDSGLACGIIYAIAGAAADGGNDDNTAVPFSFIPGTTACRRGKTPLRLMSMTSCQSFSLIWSIGRCRIIAGSGNHCYQSCSIWL